MPTYTLQQLRALPTGTQVQDLHCNILQVPHPLYRDSWMAMLSVVYSHDFARFLHHGRSENHGKQSDFFHEAVKELDHFQATLNQRK